MQRRQFLGSIGLGAVALALPPMTALAAFAAS